MSHFLSLSGRQSLPPSREMKNAKSLFLQHLVHGGHRIHDLTPVHQQYLLWPLCSEQSESKKRPLWEQVAPSDLEAINSGQWRQLRHGQRQWCWSPLQPPLRSWLQPSLPCSCLFSEPGPAAFPKSLCFSQYRFNKCIFSWRHPDLVLFLAMKNPDWYSLKCVSHLTLKPTFPWGTERRQTSNSKVRFLVTTLFSFTKGVAPGPFPHSGELLLGQELRNKTETGEGLVKVLLKVFAVDPRYSQIL